MHNRERGIGNTVFVLVLVFLIIAIFAFVTQKSDNDGLRKKAAEAEARFNQVTNQLSDVERAYDALAKVIDNTELFRSALGASISNPSEIEAKFRAWLTARANEMEQSGEFTMKVDAYQVDQTGGFIVQSEGANKTVRLYTNPASPETITLAKLFDTTGAALRWSGRAIKEAVEAADASIRKNAAEVQALKAAAANAQRQFVTANSTTQQALDTQTSARQRAEDDAQAQRAQVDKVTSEKAQLAQNAERAARKHALEVSALNNRLRIVHRKIELAEREDPADGEVVAVGETLGTVWVNLGRKDRAHAGLKLKVWRVGKGGFREDAAVIKIFRVEDDISEARIVEVLNPRLTVTKGMSVSNPFYDRTQPLTVYVWGDLRHYSNEIAQRRLENAGCVVARQLDDTVKVIVAGDPPVTVEAGEDEAAAATAERRAAAERAKLLRQLEDQAARYGAIVVSEDVLRTFVDY
jgi:hypothetical protein